MRHFYICSMFVVTMMVQTVPTFAGSASRALDDCSGSYCSSNSQRDTRREAEESRREAEDARRQRQRDAIVNEAYENQRRYQDASERANRDIQNLGKQLQDVFDR